LVHDAGVHTDLPTGTVTFVFTDVEGSTQLLDELGPGTYAGVLAEHRRIVRESSTSYGGAEVDTQGDAFFLAFERAPDGLDAAALIMERLGEGPIRLRIGVHTGAPLLTDEGYVGGDVHRAARIAAAGHGGQVLVSASTATLVDVPLRDLGEHRFKDLRAPERVFQLGEGEFPPLKSLHRSNLPVPATPFLGREHELEAVVALLTDPDTRLLTLTGPGGTGKTRLALQAAAETADAFPDGVWWVPLAPLRDAALVLPMVARALEVSEQPDIEMEVTLGQALHGRRMLLLIDNLEHLLPEAGEDLGALGTACPTLTLLATSRERLQLQAETTWPVPPMSETDGVRLFVERARQAGVGLALDETVRELCRRLDELPLALELAAARTGLFSPVQLLDRLAQRLDLLKGSRDADPRQQTLRATIDWSHELLTDDEQRVYRALSVFAGGCTWEAAEQVAGADPDLLQSLLDKSLVRRRDTQHGPRYWMLETIREHAHAELERAGEVTACESALTGWLRGELERRAESLLIVETEAIGWLAEEEPNLQIALRRVIDARDRDALLSLIESANSYWMSKSAYRQGAEWTSAAIRLTEGEHDSARADSLRRGAFFARLLGRYGEARAWLEEAIDVAHVSGDVLGEAKALQELGRFVAQTDSERDRVVALFERALELEEAGQATEHDRGITRYRYGASLGECDDPDGAMRELSEADRLFAASGFAYGRTMTRGALGWVQILHGDLDTGLALSADALEGFLQAGDWDGVSRGLGNIASGLVRRGQDSEAALLGLVMGRIDTELGTAVAPAWQSEVAKIHQLVASLPDADRDRLHADASSMSRDDAAHLAIALCRSLQ